MTVPSAPGGTHLLILMDEVALRATLGGAPRELLSRVYGALTPQDTFSAVVFSGVAGAQGTEPQVRALLFTPGGQATGLDFGEDRTPTARLDAAEALACLSGAEWTQPTFLHYVGDGHSGEDSPAMLRAAQRLSPRLGGAQVTALGGHADVGALDRLAGALGAGRVQRHDPASGGAGLTAALRYGACQARVEVDTPGTQYVIATRPSGEVVRLDPDESGRVAVPGDCVAALTFIHLPDTQGERPSGDVETALYAHAARAATRGDFQELDSALMALGDTELKAKSLLRYHPLHRQELEQMIERRLRVPEARFLEGFDQRPWPSARHLSTADLLSALADGRTELLTEEGRPFGQIRSLAASPQHASLALVTDVGAHTVLLAGRLVRPQVQVRPSADTRRVLEQMGFSAEQLRAETLTVDLTRVMPTSHADAGPVSAAHLARVCARIEVQNAVIKVMGDVYASTLQQVGGAPWTEHRVTLTPPTPLGLPEPTMRVPTLEVHFPDLEAFPSVTEVTQFVKAKARLGLAAELMSRGIQKLQDFRQVHQGRDARAFMGVLQNYLVIEATRAGQELSELVRQRERMRLAVLVGRADLVDLPGSGELTVRENGHTFRTAVRQGWARLPVPVSELR